MLDGFQFIQTMEAQRRSFRKKGPGTSCATFQCPEGMVPWMIYGAKGRKLIERLVGDARDRGTSFF